MAARRVAGVQASRPDDRRRIDVNSRDILTDLPHDPLARTPRRSPPRNVDHCQHVKRCL